ncbi:hypothetical protein D9M69_728220 [compost metagenome]
MAAPTAPATAAVSAKPAILMKRVFTPRVCARCSSAPMPRMARPKCVRRMPMDSATAITASASMVKYTVSRSGTTMSTRPTVPVTLFSK